ncbi:MAG: UDP-N-acetylmuramate--L-alanine ligase [Oscillospiraceae bacterium]
MTDLDILKGKKHIHFIGIGGSGMYPLAQILHSKGYFLTGSDNNETETLDAVRKMGIEVKPLGQRAENIEGADLIVHTAAIMPDNPELIAARLSGVPVLERSELLGVVTSWYDNAVCVAGTHGKTTTTSMLTQILFGAGLDISAFIGGKLPAIKGSGRAGTSDIMTCEACEFVDTFLKLYPDVAVVLNIDADHLDYFKTVENIIKSFNKFCNNATKAVIFNGDDENTRKSVNGITGKEMISFGYSDKNDYYPENIVKINGTKTEFDLMHKGEKVIRLTINVPGEHNVLNAVAASAAALYCKVSAEGVRDNLCEFRGAGRRFEKLCEKNGVTVVDDYAHHPAEIKVTLNAAMGMGYKRVWAVFQPFTFSRTAILLNEFAEALSIADKVVLTEIMGSREKNTYHIYARDLGEKIDGAFWIDNLKEGESEKEYHDRNFEEIAMYLKENVREGDLVITLGCGDVYKVAKRLCALL